MNYSQYAAMFTLLAKTATRYTECIKITRADGTIYRFTAHDKQLVTTEGDGRTYTYEPAGAFELTQLETQIGLAVSNMDVTGIITDDHINETDLMQGKFENAKVELFIAYWSNRRVHLLPLRVSWIGEQVLHGPSFKADLRGIAQRLNNIYVKKTSLECRYDFCDANCTLNAATYTESYTVQTVSTRDQFTIDFVAGGALGDNRYQWGKATFTSGNNNGVSMEVLTHYQTKIQLFTPLNADIQVGDTLDILAGCSGTYDECVAYGNLVNMGAEPLLTGTDVLTKYASNIGNP